MCSLAMNPFSHNYIKMEIDSKYQSCLTYLQVYSIHIAPGFLDGT